MFNYAINYEGLNLYFEFEYQEGIKADFNDPGLDSFVIIEKVILTENDTHIDITKLYENFDESAKKVIERQICNYMEF